MYNPQETAFRIKNIARSKNVSIAELQTKCGLGKNAINQLSDSQEGMKSKNIYMIADYLNCSIDYLLGRTNNSNSITNGDINNSSVAQANGDNNRISIQSNIEHPYAEIIEHLDSLSPAERRHAIADLMDVLESQYPIKKK